MNKKKQPATINNINQLNLEIDYDKLAEAIVKAQEKTKEQKESEHVQTKRLRLFRAIKNILFGKSSKNGMLSSAPFALVVSVVFRLVALIGFGLSLYVPFSTINTLINASWEIQNVAGNIVTAVYSLIWLLLCFLLAVLFWGAANDVKREKDKNYIIGLFSGIVSVAALIVAIIALYNGIA